MFLLSTKICEASKTDGADPDQTALVGVVWSGSTMFASMADAVILLAFKE